MTGKRRAWAGLAAIAVAAMATAAAGPPPAPGLPPGGVTRPTSRRFRFTYSAAVTGLPPGKAVRLWVPVPSSDVDQDVSERRRVTPAGATVSVGADPTYGNRMLCAAAAGADGTVPVSFEYRVVRRAAGTRPATNPAGVDFLHADAKVPVGGRGLSLLAGRPLRADPVAKARVLYDTVADHLEYRKEMPGWGTGDADWACGSGFGNCTDFHSLFIALARGTGRPAKFEVGFLLPDARGAGTVAGYHCWAWFEASKGRWSPVDVSEGRQHPADRDYDFGHLTPDRVGFDVGRDLTLAPPQAGPPLNFFVYPYAEVDGRPWPAERVTRAFTYADTADDDR